MISLKIRRKSQSVFAFFSIVLLAAAPLVNGQVRAGAEAGSRAGVGRAYEAAGRSAKAREVQDKMNVTLQRAILRARKLRSGGESAGRAGRTGIVAPPAVRRGAPLPTPMPGAISQPDNAFFRADPNLDVFAMLVDTIGSTPDEKAFLSQVFTATKTTFEAEVAKTGRQNNLAAALTFFITSSVMVYHNDPEPSDAAVDNLWDGMNAVINESPEYAGLSDNDKQVMYDTLIAFSGLVLAGYIAGKQTNDTATLALYRQLAGVMIEMVLKTKPDRVRFVNNALVVS